MIAAAKPKHVEASIADTERRMAQQNERIIADLLKRSNRRRKQSSGNADRASSDEVAPRYATLKGKLTSTTIEAPPAYASVFAGPYPSHLGD